jgi:triacylglycerol esterase/lipase EstA (alpha/beta hydrolase family)
VAKATAQEGDLGSGYRSNRSRRSLTLGGVAKHLQILALIVLALFLNRVPLQAQPSPPSRPVLFVHGWCGSAYDWAPFFDPNNKYGLPALLPASIYPNQDVYLVEYNRKAKTIGFWKEESPQSGSQTALTYVGVAVPSDVRLFALNFIDPNPSSTNPVDPVNVARSSVLNKAYEIAVVAQYIEQLTYSKQINIIAHSLGGLDARAYVENMASAGDCYDYGSNPGNSFPDYGVTTSACLPGYGPAAYAGDVANIITLDTPHNGSPLANSWQAGLAGLGYTCQSTTTTNSYELVPNNVLLNTLNY